MVAAKVLFEDEAGRVEVETRPDGHRCVQVVEPGPPQHVRETWPTAYPEELIHLIARARGSQFVIDEICREEDPLYVQACLEKDLLAYVAPEDFEDKRLLDFGCGAGASSMILARLLPQTEIIGLDLSQSSLELAHRRAAYYGYDHVHFRLSPAGDTLPDQIGQFDYIVLSAVYEHLLPSERPQLLSALWRLLRPGGVLFLDQTPWRFFPFEGHTTRLLMINYLPDALALWAARRFSARVEPDATWQQLLRRGMRGGTVRQIMRILRSTPHGRPELLRPSRLGIQDRVDLWKAGYAVAIARRHPRVAGVQRILYTGFKIVRRVTGLTIVPALSLAIHKQPEQ